MINILNDKVDNNIVELMKYMFSKESSFKCIFMICMLIFGVTVSQAQNIIVSGVVVADSTEAKTYDIDVIQGNNPANTHKMDSPSFQLKVDASTIPCNLRIRKDGFRIMEVALADAENDTIDLGMLRLEPLSQALDEVVVSAKRPVMSINKGTISVRIEGTSLENMGEFTDMMEYVPGMIRKGDKMEVLGRGLPLYLLNGIEIKNEDVLASLKSSQISKIEIIKHPSSAYPSGTKAVINIITKSTLKDELSISVASSTHIRRKTSESPSISVSYNKKKWLMNLSYKYGYGQNLNKETYYRDIYSPSRTFHAEWQRYSPYIGKGHRINYSVDYNLSDNHKIGFMYQFTHINDKEPITGQNIEDSSTNGTIVKDVIQNDNSKINRHSININWTSKLTDNSSLQLIQDMSFNSKDEFDEVKETNVKTKSVLQNITDGKNKSDIYTTNLKYKNENIASMSGSFGLRYDYFKTDMETSINDVLKGIERNYCNSISTENIYSAYGELSKEWEKFDISAGLRYEYLKRSISNALAIGAKPEVTDNSNKGLFPRLSMEYRPHEDLSVSLNYETELSNPQLSMLNSGMIYQDSLTYETGDINIKPTYTHTLSLGVNWKAFNIDVSYEYTKNYIITPYTQIDSESDIVCSSPVNIEGMNELGIDFGFNKNRNKWNASANIYVGLPHCKIMYLGKEITVDKPYSSGKARLSYNLCSKISFYTQFMYQSSNEVVTTVQKNLNKWDVGITGNIGRLKYSLSFNDILHRAHFNNVYDRYQNVKDGTFGTNDMRGLTISLSYKLFSSKNSETRNEIGNTNILNRL